MAQRTSFQRACGSTWLSREGFRTFDLKDGGMSGISTGPVQLIRDLQMRINFKFPAEDGCALWILVLMTEKGILIQIQYEATCSVGLSSEDADAQHKDSLSPSPSLPDSLFSLLPCSAPAPPFLSPSSSAPAVLLNQWCSSAAHVARSAPLAEGSAPLRLLFFWIVWKQKRERGQDKNGHLSECLWASCGGGWVTGKRSSPIQNRQKRRRRGTPGKRSRRDGKAEPLRKASFKVDRGWTRLLLGCENYWWGAAAGVSILSAMEWVREGAR